MFINKADFIEDRNTFSIDIINKINGFFLLMVDFFHNNY